MAKFALEGLSDTLAKGVAPLVFASPPWRPELADLQDELDAWGQLSRGTSFRD